MAVGLKEPGNLLAVNGVRLMTAEAGVRYTNRDDMLLMEIAEGSSVAAVFTQNKYCAAPVIVAKEHIAQMPVRALLINAGNANAGTGKQGLDNARQTCAWVSKAFDLLPQQILPFSTGVIGEQLPMDAMLNGVSELVEGLSEASNGRSENNWLSAAKAIMTTDTRAKAISRQIELDGHSITITGIAKGSGMICPNMATMLSYVATDADIEAELLQALLCKANNASFNRITVDSDTSTNDALVLIATAKSSAAKISDETSAATQTFYQALEQVLIELATAVVRDGEGATKFVKVEVGGGVSEADCEAIAYSVAHSPLVKTALFASDPNWGRILAAIGKAPIDNLELDKVDISVNNVALIVSGEPAVGYTEAAGKQVFEQDDITISIDLNLASADYHVWTSDLSHEYVSINADYRS